MSIFKSIKKTGKNYLEIVLQKKRKNNKLFNLRNKEDKILINPQMRDLQTIKDKMSKRIWEYKQVVTTNKDLGEKLKMPYSMKTLV